jgi:hypothetical protein
MCYGMGCRYEDSYGECAVNGRPRESDAMCLKEDQEGLSDADDEDNSDGKLSDFFEVYHDTEGLVSERINCRAVPQKED